MGELAANTGKKALALGVLLVVAYFLFKVVIGVVTTIAWIAVVVLGVIAVIWAIRTL